MHAIEKILAKAAGTETVETGQIYNCSIDMAGINDLYIQAVYSFREMGGKSVYSPNNVAVFLDHYAPASSEKQAQNQKEFREFCTEQKIDNIMDINEGVCHQVLVDKGLSAPGKVIVVTDSHTTQHGALGAFSTGVGATDLAVILITGKLWFRIPEILKIELNGTLSAGVYAKDVILHIIGALGADYAVYKCIEFAGTLIPGLSIQERMTLCNMTTEMGAKCSYIQPDEIVVKHMIAVNAKDYQVFHTDADFQYAETLTYDVSKIEPCISVPSSVDCVEELKKTEGVPINQAYIGSCTGGKLDDLRIAAKVLLGKKINRRTRMLVVPASKEVLLQGIKLGYITTLIEAGATIVTPGCASCLGTHEGILASGEVCISSTNRNFPGRMGHPEAKIYLASPAVVAASAYEGKIADARKYL